jgi:hypothetical protein
VATGFDPEAEQEVDFARYGRMLARRWWLVAVGVVAGAVIGYLVALGGTKLYDATATIYVGQPYNTSGSIPLISLQTNPSAISQIANSQAVDATVAAQCKTSVKSFGKGISVQHPAAATATKGLASQVNPLVTLTVETSKGKVATCVANGLSRAAVAGVATYVVQQVAFYEKHIASDQAAIKALNAAIFDPTVSSSDKIALVQVLKGDQTDLFNTSGLLLQAKDIESPRVTVPARARQVTAQSHKNTVLIAALMGLILGVLGALLWDRVVPRFSTRNGS